MNISVLRYKQGNDVVIIGAGMAGLAAALELSHLGYRVHVIEQADKPGGKVRQVPSVSGPVDIGPTVLTMVHVFRDLFQAVGENLDDHIELIRQKLLVRHWWADGTSLDLFDCHDSNLDSIQEVFGAAARREYATFQRASADLFDAFDRPMMQNPDPSFGAMNRVVLQNPSLISKIRPHQTLATYLSAQFSNPKLAQLFGRYATYVGGSPMNTPAMLSLIWQAEERGVWAIKGGMAKLAGALERLAIGRGAKFSYKTRVEKIDILDGQTRGVFLENGEYIAANFVVFNGDTRALALGHLGPDASAAITTSQGEADRSLSAYVWGFAGKYSGPDLIHHNVFFADRSNSEFDDIKRGIFPTDPTIYICAQDRGKNMSYPENERFEMIVNAAPASQLAPNQEDFSTCNEQVLKRLAQFGVTFETHLEHRNLTTPTQFAVRFPGSDGSLYGPSPSGMLAALKKPKTQSRIAGLYLVGGGVHPGAGVPMVTLCARQAVAKITNAPISTSTSHQMATRGGISTA